MDEVLQVRMTAAEKQALRDAAGLERMPVSVFARRVLLKAAEEVVTR
jgi:uncharacterized protein (DUF1778 family)